MTPACRVLGQVPSNVSLAAAGLHGGQRLVVLDEGDGSGHYPPAAKEPYLVSSRVALEQGLVGLSTAPWEERRSV